ncbi:hypothetical protein PybrP1_009608 [[Pythium] brassicae (nom. inval.)]|nr:hypothetical protein PybrP1_009608 [[Pythium] brassicae (nom. inval.)]
MWDFQVNQQSQHGSPSCQPALGCCNCGCAAYTLLGEEEAQVFGCEASHGAHARTDCALKDQPLLLLELEDPLLDRARDDEPRGLDGLELSKPVRAVNRLALGRRVPPRVHQEDAVDTHKVQ